MPCKQSKWRTSIIHLGIATSSNAATPPLPSLSNIGSTVHLDSHTIAAAGHQRPTQVVSWRHKQAQELLSPSSSCVA